MIIQQGLVLEANYRDMADGGQTRQGQGSCTSGIRPQNEVGLCQDVVRIGRRLLNLGPYLDGEIEYTHHTFRATQEAGTFPTNRARRRVI